MTANIAPKLMSEMCRLAGVGEVDKSRQVDQKLLKLHKNLSVETNPIPVKWAIAEMSLIGKAMWLPMTELYPQFQKLVRQSLVPAGVL